MRLQLRFRLADSSRMRFGDHPGNRDLTSREISFGLLGAAGMLGWVTLFAAGYFWTGVVLGVAGFAVFLWKADRGELERIGAELERRDRTPSGRVLRFLHSGLLALLAAAILWDWLIG